MLALISPAIEIDCAAAIVSVVIGLSVETMGPSVMVGCAALVRRCVGAHDQAP